MTRYTIKDLRIAVDYINEVVIADTGCKISVERANGLCYLYQVRRYPDPEVRLRLLFAGNTRECRIYIQGYRHAKWYFISENDLPF